ncbi:MAG: hypothetical protein IPN97_04600 [Saprospiraceae bacterium]|nr:hypothetical protein [Saprospiraceae bacterium]
MDYSTLYYTASNSKVSKGYTLSSNNWNPFKYEVLAENGIKNKYPLAIVSVENRNMSQLQILNTEDIVFFDVCVEVKHNSKIYSNNRNYEFVAEDFFKKHTE